VGFVWPTVNFISYLSTVLLANTFLIQLCNVSYLLASVLLVDILPWPTRVGLPWQYYNALHILKGVMWDVEIVEWLSSHMNALSIWLFKNFRMNIDYCNAEKIPGIYSPIWSFEWHRWCYLHTNIRDIQEDTHVILDVNTFLMY